MLKRHTLFAAVLLAACVTPAPPAAAQQGDLSGLLLRFFSPSNPVVLRPNSNPALDHSAHFVSQNQAQVTLNGLNQSIATQLSAVPVASSSAAFAYTFDSSLGVFNRSTESFGPAFAERALTAGKGKFSFGVNYLHASYDQLDDKDLGAGDIQFYLTHLDVNDDENNLNPWFEGDLIRANLFLNIENDTTVAIGTYGVSDRFDLSLAVPYTKVDVSARIHTTIEHVSTAPDPFVVHAFDNGTDDNDFSENGSASGIGDVLVRGKYNFHRGSSLAVAALAELRLPTGDDKNLLGSGNTQTRLSLVASGSGRRFSPHANLGYTLSSGSGEVVELPDEINYTAGFDASLHPRVSFSADLVGRTLRDTGKVVDTSRSFQFAERLDPSVRTVTRTETTIATGNVNNLIGVVGVKINPAGRLLVSGNVLFSIGKGGLRDKVTPVFGIDYNF